MRSGFCGKPGRVSNGLAVSTVWCLPDMTANTIILTILCAVRSVMKSSWWKPDIRSWGASRLWYTMRRRFHGDKSEGRLRVWVQRIPQRCALSKSEKIWKGVRLGRNVEKHPLRRKRRGQGAVSYTHLDVYKRQGLAHRGEEAG